MTMMIVLGLIAVIAIGLGALSLPNGLVSASENDVGG